MPFFASEAISLQSSIVIAAFLSFVLSLGAAILAINLYALLRTGRMGASWRVLIIASVLFALLQAVKLAEVVSPAADAIHISSVIEVVFVLALAYAFWLQRQVFAEHHHAEKQTSSGEDDLEPLEVSPYETYS
jgi:hypothetical protein